VDPEVLKVRDDMTSYSISSISSSFLAALVGIMASFFGEGWYADVEHLHLEGDDVLRVVWTDEIPRVCQVG